MKRLTALLCLGLLLASLLLSCTPPEETKPAPAPATTTVAGVTPATTAAPGTTAAPVTTSPKVGPTQNNPGGAEIELHRVEF